VNNVEIYGGFAGTETALAERDWEANQTILSGDINGSGNLAGNAYSVVTGSVTDATAVIDGFTITVGNADDNTGDPFTPNRHGGGMYNSGGSPTVTNSTFSENSAVNFGGGMFNSGSSPTLTNVTFSGNSAGTFGGGMHNRDNSSPMVSNSTFIGNSALLGGGMLNFISTPTVTNTTFSGNSATERGGGMYNGASSPLVTNCTITENTASIDSGGIYNEASSPVFTNCIIWGNSNGEILGNAAAAPTVSYSIVQGGYTGTGNVNSDPLFVDAAGGDYRLTEFSPAINAGSNAPFEPGGAAEGITTDLGGNDRIFGDTVDMGAYEFQEEPGVVPGGEDRRVLVSNAVASYTLTGSDLSVDGTVSAVRIEQLVGGGTLQLDGTPVTGADLPLTIDAGDITSEKLIWSPDADNYGYGYASITFLLVNEFDVESTDEATLYIDLAAASVDLTGSKGWRFITSSATGETIGSFLGPLWTQGFPGSDFPGASFANVQKLDQPNYQWDPNVNATDEFTRGLGLIVYAYEDVDGAGGGFPLTLNSGQQWTSLSDEFDFSAMFLSGGGDVGPTFYLFANPHPIALDFCEFASSDIAVSASFWDPAANGGNGDYINRSCAVDPDETVPIAPFQAFWVLTTGLNPSLSIPEAAYLETTTDGYFKEVESGLVASAATTPNELESSAQTGASETYLFSLNVTSRDGVFTNTAYLLFGVDATPELDKWDAPKISPEGLAPKWLSFYSLDEDGRNYAIQSLPHLFEDQTRIPMNIETTQAGTFTMDWTLPESHQVSAEYYLRDNETGEVIELTDGNTYSFEISENVVEKRPDRFPQLMGLPSEMSGDGSKEKPVRSEPRFELLITTDGSDGFAGLGDLPETFTLNQNYPNPFNPTTVISYELPQSTQVRLQVYDMAGRQVATLVSGQVAAGRHSINFDASQLSSGVYLYRLQAGSSVLTRKLTILK
jgi:predicted outer membrane repeat protein